MEQGFPPELERLIFQAAAEQDPKWIPTLLRVCHRVHTWRVTDYSVRSDSSTSIIDLLHRIKPLLHKVLIIIDLDSPMLSALESRAVQAAVTHVFLWTPKRQQDAIKVAKLLCNCLNIVDLVIDGPGPIFPELLDLLDQMRLQKLTIMGPPCFDWGGTTLERPLFRSITHLALHKKWQGYGYLQETENWHIWSQLASLPVLTHVSLAAFLQDILPGVLAGCSRLCVVIIAFWGADARKDCTGCAQYLTISDPRIVVMALPSDTRDWECGAWGGADYWTRAEAFVSQNRDNGDSGGKGLMIPYIARALLSVARGSSLMYPPSPLCYILAAPYQRTDIRKSETACSSSDGPAPRCVSRISGTSDELGVLGVPGSALRASKAVAGNHANKSGAVF
ncbi:hypothetical protein DFH06DRAFT_1144917 [Mycena polygramma]|nr:hypothetical protein DFH06DRAFT_1144917 [Mycena polygramma]